MSSSNINDTNAIQAILDRLRSSEAWQRAVAANAAQAAGTVETQTDANSALVQLETDNATRSLGSTPLCAPPSDHNTSPQGLDASTTLGPASTNTQSVASLLSQLQASSTFAAVTGTSRTPGSKQPAYAPSPAGSPEFPGPVAALPSSSTDIIAPSATTVASAPRALPPRQDLRNCTFQQALPHIARLSEDAGFLKALTAMRAEQADLERQLWKERREIQRKHEERVKTARTKASIIGAGLTQYEADTMTDSFRAELAKFDRERVLPAWDGLLTKQQAALESLGVPAMFPTTQTADRERQQEIMQVLGRIVKNEGSHPTRSPDRDG
ncbi:hypothetical protein ACG7TL_003512 [Trametes sanguinea]